MLTSVEVEILPHSAYRIKNLPGGPRAVTRWSSVKKRNLNCGENTDRKTNTVSPEYEI
jgi:hypothetical protein